MAWDFEPSAEFQSYLDKVKENEWMPCPKCGEEKTYYIDNKKSGMGLLIVAFCTAVLGVAFFPLWILTLICTVGGLITVFSGEGPHSECKRCKFKWQWSEVEELKPKTQAQ